MRIDVGTDIFASAMVFLTPSGYYCTIFTVYATSLVDRRRLSLINSCSIIDNITIEEDCNKIIGYEKYTGKLGDHVQTTSQLAICMQNMLTQYGCAASPSGKCTPELSQILLDFREVQVDCGNKKYEQPFQVNEIRSRKNKEVRLELLLKKLRFRSIQVVLVLALEDEPLESPYHHPPLYLPHICHFFIHPVFFS